MLRKFEPSSDQLIGRVLSELPHQQVEFATNAPHFKFNLLDSDNHLIDQSRVALFGKVTQRRKTLTKMLLASLIFHYDWLKSTLDISHPIRQSVLLYLSENHIRK